MLNTKIRAGTLLFYVNKNVGLWTKVRGVKGGGGRRLEEWSNLRFASRSNPI